MAGVNRADLLDNARALELYMRASPEAASFIDCFGKENTPSPSHVIFRYSVREPGPEEARMAAACRDHLQKFFLAAHAALGTRIDREVAMKAQSVEPPPELAGVPATRAVHEAEYAEMILAIDLHDPRLKPLLLQLTADHLNNHIKQQVDYTLSYFPTAEQAGQVGHEGLTDTAQAQQALEKPFAAGKKVKGAQLEPLLSHMEHIAAILPQRTVGGPRIPGVG